MSVLLCTILLFSFSIADVGNHSSYGGNSGSSGSSGNSGSSGRSRSGSNSYYSSSSESSDAGSTVMLLLVIGFVIFVVFISYKTEKPKETITSIETHSIKSKLENSIPDNTDEINAALKQFDQNFDSQSFISWSKELFVKMQLAWSERDWEKIRPFESDKLFSQHEMQLKEYINNETINIMKDINVNEAYLYKYNREKEYEYLTVFMAVSMLDYIIDEYTGKVLKGNPNKDCYMSYLLTFMRKSGAVTDTYQITNSTISCPKCGAPVQLDKQEKCEHCNFIVKASEIVWLLTDLESINSNTIVNHNAITVNK